MQADTVVRPDKTVTVVSGTIVLVPGTTRWVVQGTPGSTLDKVIYPHQTSPDVPEAVLVETASDGGKVLRGVSDGLTTSITPISGGAIAQTMGDSFGGVLLLQASGESGATLQRIGFTPDVLPWRYASEAGLGNVVQTHDGTIFATETRGESAALRAASVVVIDGGTGAVRSRVPIAATQRSEVVLLDCMTGYNQVYESVGLESYYALSTDSRYAVITTEADGFESWVAPAGGCGDRWGWGRGRQDLLIVDSAGAATSVELSTWNEAVSSSSGSATAPLASGLSADARGNFIVADVGGDSRVIGPGAGGPALPIQDRVIVNDAGMYVIGDDGLIVARDIETGAVLWTANVPGQPIAFAADGRNAVLVNDNGQGYEVGPEAASDPNPLPQVDDLANRAFGRWNGRLAFSFVEFYGPDAEQPHLAGLQGNNQGQGSAQVPRDSWYPELPRAEKDAIYWAWSGLRERLAQSAFADAAQTEVFDKLTTGGTTFTSAGFRSYLTQMPRLLDGLRSTFCNVTAKGGGPEWGCVAHTVTGTGKVRTEFVSDPILQALTWKGKAPATIFFRPASIGLNGFGRNLGNVGLLFHEALHGYVDLYDEELKSRLGITGPIGYSCKISEYIQNRLLLAHWPGIDPQNLASCP